HHRGRDPLEHRRQRRHRLAVHRGRQRGHRGRWQGAGGRRLGRGRRRVQRVADGGGGESAERGGGGEGGQGGGWARGRGGRRGGGWRRGRGRRRRRRGRAGWGLDAWAVGCAWTCRSREGTTLRGRRATDGQGPVRAAQRRAAVQHDGRCEVSARRPAAT